MGGPSPLSGGELRSLAEDAGSTHVLLNNCYRNYAQINARQLADLLNV